MRYAMISERGSREINEDYVGKALSENSDRGCFVLCDGLGGESVLQKYQTAQKDKNFIENAIREGQERLLTLQRERHEQSEMKTTAVVLYIDDMIQWCHVGDSRLYYFQKKKLVQRTLDHSVPQMLVYAGEIKEKEIRNHPDRNRLLRVMGMEWGGSSYTLAEPVEKADEQAFLLCSDGFWELIVEKDMQKCLKKAKSPEEWLELMREIVLKNGKGRDMDNFSAIAVWL